MTVLITPAVSFAYPVSDFPFPFRLALSSSLTPAVSLMLLTGALCASAELLQYLDLFADAHSCIPYFAVCQPL